MSQEKIPLWYLIAKKEIGTKEYPGSYDNPRIVEYHSATTLHSTDDEVPWCASFVCWCLERAGIESTHSARARDFMKWGYSLSKGQLGAITVFRRNGGGHVGFWFGEDDDGIFILGGNQNDSVNISYFSHHRLLGYRWPNV